MERYNFNEHIIKNLANIFGGSERKRTVILDDGNTYLLKLPDPIREKKRSLSYINNAISEYIGCKVIESVGLSVQEVVLGEYTVESENGYKTYIACACKNIVPEGYALAEADKSSLGSEHDTKEAQVPAFLTLNMIVESVPEISLDELINFYSDLFVVDAFIGNPDRHNGNWGFLTGILGDKIAPIYDCGSSLCPLSTDEELNEKLINNDIANALSVIQGDDGKKIKYKDYLYSCCNENVNAALKRIIPKIDIMKVYSIIDNTPYISERRKEFYKKLLHGRYTQVLLPALERLFVRDITSIGDIAAPEIQRLYKDNIESLSNIPIGDSRMVDVNGRELFARRVTNKYVLFVNIETFEAEALFSVRSSNRDVRKTMAGLKLIYGDKIKICIKDKVKDYFIPTLQQESNVKPSLSSVINSCEHKREACLHNESPINAKVQKDIKALNNKQERQR